MLPKCNFIWCDFHAVSFSKVSQGHHGNAPVMYYTKNHLILILHVITLDVTFTVLAGSSRLLCLFTTFAHPRAPAAVTYRLHFLLLHPSSTAPRHWCSRYQSEATEDTMICDFSPFFCNSDKTLSPMFERICGVSRRTYSPTHSKQSSTLIHSSHVK